MLKNDERKLGKSDIEITPIGLGVWQFSEAQGIHKYFWKAIDPQTRTEIVDISVKSGINWFDTAEVYGNGKSERGLRDSLQELETKHPDVLIATKWNPIMRRARSIGKTIGKRLENLSPYPITLHQIHNAASFSKPETEMVEMAKLLRDEKVKSVGVSNFSTDKTVRAYEALEKEGYPLVSNQVRYSILDRRPERKLIDKAKELGITIIAYSPLAQGLATGRFHKNPETISTIPFIRKRRFKRKFESATKLLDEMENIG